jgi:hypothetical protein
MGFGGIYEYAVVADRRMVAKAISCCDSEGDLFSVCGVAKAGENISSGEVWKVLKDFILGYARC